MATPTINADSHGSVVAGLRRWAQGAVGDEAAVELLAGLGARFVTGGCPWVRPCPGRGWYWLDPDELRPVPGRLSADQRRVLSLVAALLDGRMDAACGGAADTGQFEWGWAE